jgi:hypothetical protein
MLDKLDPKSDKYIFIGYLRKTNGYYFYHRLDNKVFITRYGVFLEEKFLFKENSGRKVTLKDIQNPLF